MWKRGDAGWESPVVVESWKKFEFGLDEYNEVVNFYFDVDRPGKDCGTCGGGGHHPDAQWITDSWYRHTSPFAKETQEERQLAERFGMGRHKGILGRGTMPPDELLEKYGKPFYEHCVTTMENGGEWNTNITQDEADALWDGDRLKFEFKEKPTAKQVNDWQRGTRVAIAQQVLSSDHFILMDEPFSGLDPINVDIVCGIINDVACLDELNTVIITSHDVSAVTSVADHLWLLGRDKAPDGSVIPGARVQKIYDLVEMGLCWQADIQTKPEFAEFVRKLKLEFKEL